MLKMNLLFGVLFLVMSYLNAGDKIIQAGAYTVRCKATNFTVYNQKEKAMFNASTQFLVPGKNRSFGRKTFLYKDQKIEKNEDFFLLKGNGVFKENMSIGQGLTLNADIEMNYSARFYPSGKIKLKYSFSNKGDDMFFKPFIDIKLNYAFLKGQKWELFDSNGTSVKSGIWPEKVRNAFLSPHSLGGGRFKESHLTKGIFHVSTKNQLTCILSDLMQLRIIGAGALQIYNYKYSSASRKPHSNYKNYNDGWTSLPAEATVIIEAEIVLPDNRR